MQAITNPLFPLLLVALTGCLSGTAGYGRELEAIAGTDRTAAPAAGEGDVRKLLKEWDDAFKRRDPEALARFLGDDYVMTNANGAVMTKKQYVMSVVKAPDMLQVGFESEDVNVRLYGDAAVVTGRSPVKGRPGGRTQFLAGAYRFTDLFVKREGRWWAVATHSTAVTDSSR